MGRKVLKEMSLKKLIFINDNKQQFSKESKFKR